MSLSPSPALQEAARVHALGRSPASEIVLSRSRIGAWGARSILALVDQGLTSGAGFCVNLLLARWLSPDVYGAFAVAFATFLFVSGFHNVLVLEPLSVFGPSRYASRLPEYFRSQMSAHAILTCGLALIALAGAMILRHMSPGSPLIAAALGAGVSLPFLPLLWLARRMCYVLQRPSIAVTGSAFYIASVIAGLFALERFGRLSSFTAFLLMGCGSLMGACLLLWQLGLLKFEPAAVPRVSWNVSLRENWSYGRWLAGSAVLFSVSSQTQMFFAAAFLGLGAAGILRAMQIPSLLMTQVITSAGLLFLPVFSRDFGRGAIGRMRHKAILVSLGLAGAAFCFATLLGLFAGRAEHLLFGARYAAYAWLIPVLALIPVCNGISTGYSMALRGSQKPHFDFVSNLFAAPVAIISAFLFMRFWGLAGAAASMVLSFGVLSLVTLVFFRRFARNEVLPRDAAGVSQ